MIRLGHRVFDDGSLMGRRKHRRLMEMRQLNRSLQRDSAVINWLVREVKFRRLYCLLRGDGR